MPAAKRARRSARGAAAAPPPDPPLAAKVRQAMEALVQHPAGAAFRAPVDWKALGLRTYPEVVARPMDLQTLQRLVDSGEVSTLSDFWAHVELIWHNCIRFNDRRAQVHRDAVVMRAFSHALMEELHGLSAARDLPARITAEGEFVYGRESARDGGPGSMRAAAAALAEAPGVPSEAPPPAEVCALAGLLAGLSPEDSATVLQFVARETPQCLSPFTAAEQRKRRVDLDLGTLFAEARPAFDKTAALAKVLAARGLRETEAAGG